MYVVDPEFAWEVRIQSSVLVSSAMARGRPAALHAESPRLNGLAVEVVAERYTELIRLWEALPSVTPEDVAKLSLLEAMPPTSGFEPWETVVMRSGADDDPSVVTAARRVWEALGPNEYARQLRGRPRTYRGFVEGRAWADLALLGTVLFGIAAAEVQSRWGVPWWLFVPVILGWPILVAVLFRRRYRRLRRIGGRELPHF